MKKITSLFLLPLVSCLLQPSPVFARPMTLAQSEAVISSPDSTFNILKSSVDACQLKRALDRYVNPSFSNPGFRENKKIVLGSTVYHVLGRGQFLKATDELTGNYQRYILKEKYQIDGLAEFGNKNLRIELTEFLRQGEQIPVYRISGVKDRQLLQIYERLENGGVGRILRTRNLIAAQPVDKEFYYGVSASGKPMVSVFDYSKGSYLEIEFDEKESSQSFFDSKQLNGSSLPVAVFLSKNHKDFAKQIFSDVNLTPVVSYFGNMLEGQDLFKLSLILAEDDGRGPPAVKTNMFSFLGVHS